MTGISWPVYPRSGDERSNRRHRDDFLVHESVVSREGSEMPRSRGGGALRGASTCVAGGDAVVPDPLLSGYTAKTDPDDWANWADVDSCSDTRASSRRFLANQSRTLYWWQDLNCSSANRTLAMSKLGLALAGAGFLAPLFHLDVVRHPEETDPSPLHPFPSPRFFGLRAISFVAIAGVRS